MILSKYVEVVIVIILVSCQITLGQNRNSVWCFGDSSGIDFNDPFNPAPISTSLVSRGSCVSIADTTGQLLFYGNTDAEESGVVSGEIWNRNHTMMLNGDSIAGTGWYDELTIAPYPANDSLYYIFSVGVTDNFGLMYSVVDMHADNTFGQVIQKNIQITSGKFIDCVRAVKHGNGRDWWIISRPSPVGQPVSNNSWLLYLINPNGIDSIPIQNVGELNSTNAGAISVSVDGAKLCFINLGGLIEIFDFNRCTGEISNSLTIEPELPMGPFPFYWSSEFSPSSQYLYVSSTTLVSRLWQFDLNASNITSSKSLIWQVQNPANTAGALKRGPDDKIYFACSWSGGGFSFPYDSTEYFQENMNIGVINNPDSSVVACNFLPWSFYLGGKRIYKGLPNNPDYDLGPLAGSPCDTLVAINEPISQSLSSYLNIYYSSQWQTVFINAGRLTGNTFHCVVTDVVGKLVHIQKGILTSEYFTQNLSCQGFSKGMYIVNLLTEKERLTKKIIID